jgi:hypothetical protein
MLEKELDKIHDFQKAKVRSNLILNAWMFRGPTSEGYTTVRCRWSLNNVYSTLSFLPYTTYFLSAITYPLVLADIRTRSAHP